MSEKDIPVPDVDYHNQEYNVEQWQRQKIAVLEEQNKQLIEKAQRLIKIIKHVDAMNIPGMYFIHADLGEKDHNGMPEKFLVVPSYGCDFSYEYVRTNRTTGPEW